MFIVSYINVPFLYNAGENPPNTFQFVLYEGSNKIKVNYADVHPRVTKKHVTTAGIEDSTGSVGLQYPLKTAKELSVLYYLGELEAPPTEEDEVETPPTNTDESTEEEANENETCVVCTDKTLLFPHVVYRGDWSFAIALVNVGSDSDDIVIEMYDKEGNVETLERSISPYKRLVVSPIDTGQGTFIVKVKDCGPNTYGIMIRLWRQRPVGEVPAIEIRE
jgi:hypothetical protein